MSIFVSKDSLFRAQEGASFSKTQAIHADGKAVVVTGGARVDALSYPTHILQIPISDAAGNTEFTGSAQFRILDVYAHKNVTTGATTGDAIAVYYVTPAGSATQISAVNLSGSAAYARQDSSALTPQLFIPGDVIRITAAKSVTCACTASLVLGLA